MKKQFTSIMSYVLLGIGILLINGCASYAPKSIAPHINLSPENMQLAVDTDKGLDFGLVTESNESDSLDNLEVLPGIRIRSIRPAGAAENAGLKRGDIILSINGIKTNHPDTLATISETGEAEQFVFMVRRDTTVFETSIAAPKATKVAEPKERYRADPLKTRAGYRTELVQSSGDSTKKSVIARIVQLWPDSPLSNAGIEVGDAIVSVDNNSIESAQDLINRLSNNYGFGQDVVFSILKKNSADTTKQSNIKVSLWDPGRRVSKFNIWPLFMYKAKLKPDKVRFSILDFWIVSLYTYERDESERSHSILRFIRFGSGNRGELVEKSDTSAQKY
jgi:serine protease Do